MIAMEDVCLLRSWGIDVDYLPLDAMYVNSHRQYGLVVVGEHSGFQLQVFPDVCGASWVVCWWGE